MRPVTLIPTPLVAFMLDISEAWDQLEYEEQMLTQQRAEALGLCGPADYDGERQLTLKGYAAMSQFQWLEIQTQDVNVMGEL